MAKKKNVKKQKSQNEVDSLLDIYNTHKELVKGFKKDKKEIKKIQKQSAIPGMYDSQLQSIDFLEKLAEKSLELLKKALDEQAKKL